MQKIEINKNILIFQIKDRDLFTTLAKTCFVRVMKGEKQSQQNHLHKVLPHLVELGLGWEGFPIDQSRLTVQDVA